MQTDHVDVFGPYVKIIMTFTATFYSLHSPWVTQWNPTILSRDRKVFVPSLQLRFRCTLRMPDPAFIPAWHKAQVPSMAVEAQLGLASAYPSRFNQSLTTFQSVFSGFLLDITSHAGSSNPFSRELGRVPHRVLLVMVLCIFVAL